MGMSEHYGGYGNEGDDIPKEGGLGLESQWSPVRQLQANRQISTYGGLKRSGLRARPKTHVSPTARPAPGRAWGVGRAWARGPAAERFRGC